MMKNVVIFRFALIALLVALASLGAYAQPMGGDCSRLTTDLQEVAGLVDRTLINERTQDPVQVLKAALQAENRIVGGKPVPIVVELCNVELNLTFELHRQPLIIGSDRALIASPNCARGPRKLGPLIRAGQMPRDHRRNKHLFEIRGDNVLFSGFRLEGPHPDQIVRGEEHTEQGIRIYPFGSPEPIRRIEICNMEIFHWSGAAIEVRDNTEQAERGRLFNTNEGAVHIKNNFIHNNRHGAGFGYGVNVARGAYALIARNVFDENRHAISGDSVASNNKDFSGYTARENLILPGGGLHCSEPPVVVCWQTHQIDMHGTKDARIGGQYCCGTAGETIMIERNTILYAPPPILPESWDVHEPMLQELFRQSLAIKIRGNPTDKAVADGNVFKHTNRRQAIAQNGDTQRRCIDYLIVSPCITSVLEPTNPIQVRPTNVFGSDPLTELGSCDLVGDGLRDQFMATGVTWWAYSHKTNQWRYLNTMVEKLPQLQLVDVDNDGRCDVAERPPRPEVPFPRYSKSGTAPWTPRIGGDVEPEDRGGVAPSEGRVDR